MFSRLVLVNRARSFAVLKLALSRLAYRNKDNYWDKYEIGYNKALKGRVTVFKHCSSLKANDLPPCFKFLSGKHLVKVVSKHLKQVHLRIISHLNMISRLRRSLTILDISYKTLKDKLTREIVSRYISNSISNKNQEELKIRIRKYFLVKLTSIANKTKRHSKAKTLIILFFKTRDSIEKHSISTILKGWISFNRFKKVTYQIT